MADEIDAIVDAIIERGSPTLDRIIAERDELRASVEALLVLNQDQAREIERLKVAVVEIGAAHVAAQAEVERLRKALYQISRSTNYIDNLAYSWLDVLLILIPAGVFGYWSWYRWRYFRH